jgi:hypothetical protein
MWEKLSYEQRLQIAFRLWKALRSLYPNKVVTLSDSRALKLAEDRLDVQSSRGED